MTHVEITSTRDGKNPSGWMSTFFSGNISETLWFFADREATNTCSEIMSIEIEDME